MDPISQSKCSSSSSETTTNGNDLLDHVKDNSEEGTRRYYECTFCKRGFTNAQALGGHMNIHRKDRVKLPKRHNRSHVTNPKPYSIKEDDCYNVDLKSSVSRNNHRKCCCIRASPEANFLEIQSNLGGTSCYYGVLGANYLSMGVGSHPPSSSSQGEHCYNSEVMRRSRTCNGNKEEEVEEEEVDLELRLGHHYG